MRSNIRIPKQCQICGKQFLAHTLKTRYCSDNCAKKAYKLRKRKEVIEETLATSPAPFQLKESPSIIEKPFLSIEETATLLGASRRTVHRLIADGRLKAGKIGARTIIQRTAIDNLFK